jgi:hypothetical protein
MLLFAELILAIDDAMEGPHHAVMSNTSTTRYIPPPLAGRGKPHRTQEAPSKSGISEWDLYQDLQR